MIRGLLFVILIAGISFPGGQPSWALPLDPAAISKVSGQNGTFDKDNSVYKIAFERPGLKSSVNGVEVGPDFGLRASITLAGAVEHAILLGDIPLREGEANAVLRAALDSGLVVTSLHNRFMGDSPRILSIHVEGLGTQEVLSKSLGQFLKRLSELKTAPAAPKTTHLDPEKSALDGKTMEALLWKGELSKGIFRVKVGRGTTLNGQVLGQASGVESWAAFAGSKDSAVVNGDIATLEFELPFVLKDLIEAGIQITSVHTHMTQEKPKLIFVHFWGVGKAADLAAGVKAAVWEKEEFQSQ